MIVQKEKKDYIVAEKSDVYLFGQKVKITDEFSFRYAVTYRTGEIVIRLVLITTRVKVFASDEKLHRLRRITQTLLFDFTRKVQHFVDLENTTTNQNLDKLVILFPVNIDWISCIDQPTKSLYS